MKNKNPESFTEFYKLYHKPVYDRMMRYFRNNVEQAEDATQEAMLRVYEKVPVSAYAHLRFRALVFTIVKNIAMDIFRKNKNKRTEEFDDNMAVTNPSDDYSCGDDEVGTTDSSACILPEDAGFDAEIIKKMKAYLSEKDRTLFEMRYWKGMSYAEIAAALDRTTAWVGNELKHAQERFRKLLLSKGYERGDFI